MLAFSFSLSSCQGQALKRRAAHNELLLRSRRRRAEVDARPQLPLKRRRKGACRPGLHRPMVVCEPPGAVLTWRRSWCLDRRVQTLGTPIRRMFSCGGGITGHMSNWVKIAACSDAEAVAWILLCDLQRQIRVLRCRAELLRRRGIGLTVQQAAVRASAATVWMPAPTAACTRRGESLAAALLPQRETKHNPRDETSAVVAVVCKVVCKATAIATNMHLLT